MEKIRLIIVFLLLISFPILNNESASAASISIYVDGAKQSYSNQVKVQDNTTLVPLRGIFEALGAEVTWNQSTKTIDAKKGNTNVWLKLGSKSTKVNGQAVNIAVPAQASNGVTLVPLRFISESLGADVTWDGATNTIRIVSVGTYDVILEFPANQYPQTGAHIKSAIEKGESAICTIDRDGADENRDESLAGIPTKDGYDRDEFPMAMCTEGGAGASVMYVDPSDNRGAGSWVGNQLEQYPDGTRVLFKVVGTITVKPTPTPVPVKPTPTPQTGDLSTGTYVIPGAPKSFGNCAAMREYYPNGVKSTHVAYASKHDRDKDGWACEK